MQAGFGKQGSLRTTLYPVLIIRLLAGRDPDFSICHFLLLYIPTVATFKLPMGPVCKNPEYITIVSQYQLMLAHYWFGFYYPHLKNEELD